MAHYEIGHIILTDRSLKISGYKDLSSQDEALQSQGLLHLRALISLSVFPPLF